MLRYTLLVYWLAGLLSLGLAVPLPAQEKEDEKYLDYENLQGKWKMTTEVKNKEGATVKTEILLTVTDKILGILVSRQTIKLSDKKFSSDGTGSGGGPNNLTGVKEKDKRRFLVLE